MKEELKEVKEKNTTICDKMKEFEKKLDWQNPEQSPRPRRWEENGRGNTSDDMSVMKEDLTKLKRANDDFRDMIINMEKKWMERENEIVRKVTERVAENLEEMHDKEKRKKIAIVFNVLESKKIEAVERKEEDKKLCEKVFQDALKVKDARVEQAIRLGRGIEGKDRPVIVCMNEIGAK